MRTWRDARGRSWTIVAVQFFLLLVLATLQFRWTGEVSRTERQRMRAGLEIAAHRFAEDLDREIARVLVAFLPDAPLTTAAGAAERLARYRESSPYPRLVAQVYRVEASGEDGGREGELSLDRLDEASGRYEPAVEPGAAWPPPLAELERRIRSLPSRFGDRPPGDRPPGDRPPDDRPPRHGPSPLVAPEVPALVLPFFEVRGGLQPGVLIVELDRAYLRDDLLPELARRYLGGGAAGEPARRFPDYQLEIVDRGQGRPIYRSTAAPLERADVEVGLFALPPPEVLRQLAAESLGRGDDEMRGRERRPWFPGRRLGAALIELARGGDSGWLLRVRHGEGSLEAAVAKVRRRQLAVGFAILLLLGGSVSMLWASGRRAERLARQQVEFVAGVTHELKTPLASIGSLGQNLADGIVRDPEQVRRYGTTIEAEVDRLGRMVDQSLAFAGILAGRPSGPREPVDLAAVIAEAVADVRPQAAAAGVEIEVAVADALPRPRAAAVDLRRAVANLLANGVKYGGGRVRVEARAARGRHGPEAEIRVADQGPGIAREDLPHLFKPFYRGRNATAAQSSGSGLGLALVRRVVEDHGGRVEVESAPGRGSTFRIRLPAAAGAEGA